jgi:hypothetical protein
MRFTSVATLVGNEVRGNCKWSSSVTGADGWCVYGIPYNARHVGKFNPIDMSLTPIGQDLGDVRVKWSRGILADNGSIYCVSTTEGPLQILKIDTIHDTTAVLDAQGMPESNTIEIWISGALALDGCIYFMPCNARRILKLDTENYSVCCVGDDFGPRRYRYKVIVAGRDGYVYGIPLDSKPITRFDPASHTTRILGDEARSELICIGDVFGRDGCIYSLSYKYDKVLKIDVVNNTCSLVGNMHTITFYTNYWGEAILGNDGCIYWPPFYARRTLKFDTETETLSLIGDDFGPFQYIWPNGAVASNGAIYCLPHDARQVLRIDPCQEFATKLKADMEEHPEALGFLFETKNFGKTLYESAITKYGKAKVFEVIEECTIPASIACEGIEIEAFMLAASCKNSNVGIIYHLLRRDLDLSPLASWSSIAKGDDIF